jgi:hypothetical protein
MATCPDPCAAAPPTTRRRIPRRLSHAAVAALALGASAGAGAEEEPLRVEALEPVRLPGALEQRFFIQEENDVFGLTRKTDVYYTQGFRVGAKWALRSASRFPEDVSRELWGFEFGQNIYTPSDIRLADLAVLRRDRPYAGYLYVGPTFEMRRRQNPIPTWARVRYGPGETDEAFSSNLFLEVRVGRTGPKALGGPVQTGFHQLLRAMSGTDRQALPAGWGIYETADVVSLDATVEYAPDWVRLSTPVIWCDLTRTTGSRLALRVVPSARLDAGGMVDAAGLGVEARFGLAEADAWPAVATSRPRIPFEFYLWGRGQGRFVAYSRFIEGGLLRGVDSDVGVERWVGDLTVGATLRIFAIELVAAEQWRTAEIRPLPQGVTGTHSFGSFQVSFLFY